ncbi:TraY domain-containing protein [Enterobacter sp. ECC-019]|uniref:TraY domain-containing protein n=1 Tax=Enterobacter sp. ECC-019 TaxID=3116478 RepID=UPI0037545304
MRLDDETNRLLIKAKDRSLRSKTAEAFMRLRDHLERFPDFYNSETTEEMKKHN